MCGGKLNVVGSRKRKVIGSGGEIQTLVIRRLRCRSCECLHHELPDMVIPYKRHCAETVEKIIVGDAGDVCCEESTIRRISKWWAACRQYFASIMTSLREKYGNVFSADPALREMIRAVANAHLWIHTRSAFLSG